MRLASLAVALAFLATPVAAPPARVQVTALEWEYRLSRPRITAGPALVELVNMGEDEHDLRLRRVGGTRTYRLGKVLPGERALLSARLAPGTFRLWCSLPRHADRGMKAQLRVSAAPKRR
jgi:hypothetical protein